MTESDYTRLLVKAVRQRLPDWRSVVFKHADMFTAGIPDFSITIGGVTTWYEAKKLPVNCVHLKNVMGGNGDTKDSYFVECNPKVHVPAVQWEHLRRLLRGFLVIYTDHGHAVSRVTGTRETVSRMKVQLISMKELIDTVLNIARTTTEDW